MREILVAQGEVHSAYNTVLLLRTLGVEAIFVDITGWRDETEMSLDTRIGTALSAIDLGKQLPVVTGYSRCPGGLVRLYGRGYTEVTFARIAVLTGAKEAIVHKEFHLSTADPKIVGIERVRAVGYSNYDVASQLSNLWKQFIRPRSRSYATQIYLFESRIRSILRTMELSSLATMSLTCRRQKSSQVSGEFMPSNSSSRIWSA
ncbi:hypothetical protein NKH89_35060 [Mesorhizobium sp. M0923]|uniref:amino acid kinase family protein n=1 Tax=Mesorhizobium sp. M0923 TaxID=2957028 RepID=UPI00333C7A28